ncbi:MAG: methyltransferase domain-containing protein [Gammaproteobacteria bacterium]
MSNNSILDLYTELANNPDKDFGWEIGLQNARNHGYKEAWIAAIPEEIWNYSAAVGNPFNAGELCEGDSVLDIGCGAGVDICVASLLVGDTGSVYGIDITPAMVEKSKHNAAIAGLSNITVYEGSFDRLPVDDGAVSIVISNGAINLAASKEIVFSEIYRVLIKGGNLYFSDMIKDESNLDKSCCNEESWADCVAGTLRSSEIVQLLEKAGFVDVSLLNTNHYKTSASTVGATFSARKA